MSKRDPLVIVDTDHFDCDGCGVYVPVEDRDPCRGTCIRTPNHWVPQAIWFHLCSDCMGDLAKHWNARQTNHELA
jgi:hypothetical protein